MSKTIQTAGVSKSASVQIDELGASMKVSEILGHCINYDRTMRYGSMPSLESFELDEKYDNHAATAIKFERIKILGANDCAAIERFYTSFMIFHHGNVEQFRLRTTGGLKAHEILDKVLNGTNANFEPIPLQDLARIRRDMRNLYKIVKRCADYLEKLETRGSNSSLNLEDAYEQFFEWAMKYKKSDLTMNVYRDAMQLCRNFEIFHDKVMKDHSDNLSKNVPAA